MILAASLGPGVGPRVVTALEENRLRRKNGPLDLGLAFAPFLDGSSRFRVWGSLEVGPILSR